MDQEALARRVGVSRSTWSRIEAGSSALNMDQLAKAAEALDVSLGELMMEADEVVRELRTQDVEVNVGRDRAVSAKPWARGATVAFLGGAVLGGVIAALLAEKNEDGESDQ